MKFTVREQWMLASLPAALTLLCYYAFAAAPASTEREKLRKQTQTQPPLLNRLAQIRRAQEERAELARVVAAQAKTEARPDLIFDRDHALQVASQLCESHRLVLISSALDPAAKLPAALLEASAAVVRPGGSVPQVWRLELRGGYVSVLEMLEEMRGKAPLMVPLCLSMQPDPDERKAPSWIVALWL